jgi:tyrosinase
VAILHRPDTKDLDLPSFAETFPAKFVDSRSMIQARQEAAAVPIGSRRPIVLPRNYTASEKEPEQRLWYFREDLGINIHHWHWHLVYPFEAADRRIVAKDRRGELFYYMHQQINARYNFERFSNNLPRVVPFRNFRAIIREGYFPKLDSLVASRSYPSRQADSSLKDINRELDQVFIKVSDLEAWRDTFVNAINQGFVVLSNGQRRPLDEATGIDTLGNMMEASILSPNENLYRDLHNMMHFIFSYIHDPDHRHLESFGVIGDSTTAMRDPIFYPIHAYVEELFQLHKAKLPPYTTQQLTYPGIFVSAVTVQPDNGRANQLSTFWQQSDVNMARGLDFVPRGDVFVRFTHLQHIPFNYSIQVENNSGAQRLGMVRIFLAPKFDERGTAWRFNEQRQFFIELDKFVVTSKDY